MGAPILKVQFHCLWMTGLWISCATGALAGGTDLTPREAVARALPYVAEQGESWITERKCVSCHRVSFMTWSMASANAQGFEVNTDRLAELEQWSRESLLATQEQTGQPAVIRNTEAVGHLLWSGAQPAPLNADEAAYDELIPLVLKAQRTGGTWPCGGQLPQQKRPRDETDLVSTLWNALGLGTLRNDPAASKARARALDAINAAPPGTSTEWYALRLLLAVQEKSNEAITHWSQQLLDLQQEDGGWGWLIKDPSDAIATGQALYALRTAGFSTQRAPLQRATQFLTKTQNPDGSWSVHGTKKAKKDAFEETDNYWGACWAVIGLTAEPAQHRRGFGG